MNEFTKEELESMHGGLANDDPYDPVTLKIARIRSKLQFMIDSYCDHEKTEFIRDVGIDRCKSCGKYIHE